MNNSILTKIKNELDIVDIVSEHVDLSKKGKNYWGLCPFHEDSNPSMSISPEKQLYKCFVCQNGGDLIKFTSEINHINFSEAISKLAKKIGIEYKTSVNKVAKYSELEQKIINIHKDADNFFQYSISTQEGQKALIYIKERGLNNSILEKFSIGYAPKSGLKEYLLSKNHDEADIINSSLENSHGKDFFRDRLIFGIKNLNGDIVSFSARDLSGNAQSKYINSAETSLFLKNQILYNYSNAIESVDKNKEIFINEGFMDVIAMFRSGIRNSVAIMGTALTDNHAKLLRKFKVILMLDGDKAGISATIKSIKVLLKNNIETFIVNNKSGKDPDEILKDSGAEELIKITQNRSEALEFIYELHANKYKSLTPNTALEFAKSFINYLENQTDLIKDFYINKLVEKLKISKEIILKIKNDFIPTKKSNNFNKIKIDTKKEVPKIKNHNNSFKLIKSMLQNKNLIKIYKENKPYFVEPILFSISNYIVNYVENKKKEKLSKELFMKINEINDYDEVVKSPEEFKEILKKVTIESYKWEILSNDVKLKSISNYEEKISLLEKITKLKKELRKHEE